MRRPRITSLLAAVLVVAVPGVAAAPGQPEEPEGRRLPPIANWFGADQVPRFIGAEHVPNPIDAPDPPQHPFMASTMNNVHNDSFASDTWPSGPVGRNPELVTAALRTWGHPCGVLGFLSSGIMLVGCISLQGVWLNAFDPTTMRLLTEHFTGQRESTLRAFLSGNLGEIRGDISGGVYGYVAPNDLFVVAGPDQILRFLRLEKTATGYDFVIDKSFDLRPHMERDCASIPSNLFPKGRCDGTVGVQPDWNGLHWFVTRYGVVGTLDTATGTVRTTHLPDPGETVGNGFATGPEGVFVVSTKALYSFVPGPDGEPTIAWRETYDRGVRLKPGQAQQGSGTTPTLAGDDLVAIADNAEQMHVVVMDRRPDAPKRVICEVPVFESGKGALEDSLIGIGNSFVVQNNYGFKGFQSWLFGGKGPGGIARIDVRPDRSGCDVAWTSPEVSGTMVATLARDTGLVYLETKDPKGVIDAWYVTAIDFHTGRTVWKRLLGTGWNWAGYWLSVVPGPSGKDLFVSSFVGIAKLSDTP